MSAGPEPCLDARLTLGAALAASAAAVVSLALGAPLAATIQALAALALAALAVHAARGRRPPPRDIPAAPPSSTAVADAVAALTGDGPRHAARS